MMKNLILTPQSLYRIAAHNIAARRRSAASRIAVSCWSSDSGIAAYCRTIVPLFAAAAFAVLLMGGCVVANISAIDQVEPKGVQTVYEINTGAFNSIKASGQFDIHYYAGESDTVTLKIQPNVRNYYSVEVINGQLVARTSGWISFGASDLPVLTVTAPSLKSLVIDGACNFTGHDKISTDTLAFVINGAGICNCELDAASLTAEISGAGKITLSGNASAADYNMSGAGELDALALSTGNAKVKFSGAGRLALNCTGNLDIKANGFGVIQYSGSPNVSLSQNGFVSISRVN
ncbi:MAG: DUF2807 domain-containing protein [Treponema sp.]|nr:DUF2807 domain-containing protein [Treponema sp.]